ncbi:MAG: hypothetical protein GX879_02420 [Bacteroidales bacterium]|nr:hypothetical protein [Bacteroidales bacterium]
MKNPNDIILEKLRNNGYEFYLSKYFDSGMQLFRKNIGEFVAYGAIIAAIAMSLSFLPTIGSLIFSLISIVFTAGFYFVANNVLREEPIKFEQFFQGFKFAGELILAQVLISIFTFIGFLLLIIPGVYLAVSYSFTSFFIIFMKYSSWEAMEWSRKIVAIKFWPIFGLVLLMGLINLAGALFCGLGLLFTLPYTACITYSAFEDIISNARS